MKTLYELKDIRPGFCVGHIGHKTGHHNMNIPLYMIIEVLDGKDNCDKLRWGLFNMENFSVWPIRDTREELLEVLNIQCNLYHQVRNPYLYPE